MAKAARKARRKKKADESTLGGDPVVFAVAVSGDRMYRTWIRGPTTGHTNGEMIQLMGAITAPLVIETARHGKVPVAEALEEAVKMYKRQLEGTVHRALSGKVDIGEHTTVSLERDAPDIGPTGVAAKTSDA